MSTIQSPMCNKCEEYMVWVSEQIVDNKPMQVFHCVSCDKYAAALPGSNGVKTKVAPSLGKSM